MDNDRHRLVQLSYHDTTILAYVLICILAQLPSDARLVSMTNMDHAIGY
jgi:hypothetical protein